MTERERESERERERERERSLFDTNLQNPENFLELFSELQKRIEFESLPLFANDGAQFVDWLSARRNIVGHD